MKELNCREIQERCLEILRAFDAYAQKNGLTYYLAGGTLLGAVRHKGFIPWDDDVDLMMPRKDYEKLIHSFQHEQYRVDSCETNSQYATPFARIWDTHTALQWEVVNDFPIGVFIDIFPIDGYPEGDLPFQLHVRRLKLQRAKINSAIRTKLRDDEKYHSIKKILKKVWNKSGNTYAKELNQIAQKYPYDACNYVGDTTTTVHIFKERNPKKLYAKTVYLPFEDMQLPAPVGYDVYLKHLYGDYMQLPPEDKRVTEHMFKIYQIK